MCLYVLDILVNGIHYSKIGIATNARSRIGSIQSSMPFDIRSAYRMDMVEEVSVDDDSGERYALWGYSKMTNEKIMIQREDSYGDVHYWRNRLNDKRLEGTFHYIFKEHSVRGEWFLLKSEDILSHLFMKQKHDIYALDLNKIDDARRGMLHFAYSPQDSEFAYFKIEKLSRGYN